MNINLFNIGRVLRRSGLPHFLADLLPHRVFSGWVHEELRINAQFYVQYPPTIEKDGWAITPKGWSCIEEDDEDCPCRAETTVFKGDTSMKL